MRHIQAMEIQEGLNGKTSGTYVGAKLIHCVSDGTVDIIFRSGESAETVTLVTGDDRALNSIYSVEVKTGTFDINY